jgi:hypothetical protein
VLYARQPKTVAITQESFNDGRTWGLHILKSCFLAQSSTIITQSMTGFNLPWPLG